MALSDLVGLDRSPRPTRDGVPVAGRPARMALINMPFGMVDRPSIQCGLLKAAVEAAGHHAHVLYLNMELASLLGPKTYQLLSELRANVMIGEWLFSPAAFDLDVSEEAYAAATPALESFCDEAGLTFEGLRRLRTSVLPEWIEQQAAALNGTRYDLIGFTSTFEQNNASFALARRVKARFPSVPIIFGGANFDGEMGVEYVRALPFIDYAVVGEGDRVLPRILDRIVAGETPIGLKGVIGRVAGDVAGDYPADVVTDMNALPDPDYLEYFATLSRLKASSIYGNAQSPMILVESSRGCWWGQKHHCTFCGLNGNGMSYRSKAPEEAIGQLRRLSRRYQSTNFEAVDNILDYRYIEKLCTPLTRDRLDVRLFYEVKANLKREQLSLMARAGIRAIQPGIESLNSHVLELMRKGTTMLHNVRLLKWATYYGIQVYWNILTGFPGETPEDYRAQNAVVPTLRHLVPPQRVTRIWLERFSPYFFDKTYPIRNVRPLDAYKSVYPSDLLSIEKVAYFFDYDMSDTVEESVHDELRREVETWKAAWKAPTKPALAYQRAPDWIRIVDNRRGDARIQSLDGASAAIYEACTDTDRTAAQIHAALQGGEYGDLTSAAIGEALRGFCDDGIAISEDDSYLALALPINRNW